MSITWIGSALARDGVEGGGLPTPTANKILRGTGTRWEAAEALEVREDGIDAGASDDDYHNIQGRTTVFGDYDDVLMTIVGHMHVDRLHALDYVKVHGGQYPAGAGYAGWDAYGAGPDEYPGFPYWGSYPDGADPMFGTGTTIDARGLRTDARALLERGFTVYDPTRATWLTIKPELQDDGSIEWEYSEDHEEPNASWQLPPIPHVS